MYTKICFAIFICIELAANAQQSNCNITFTTVVNGKNINIRSKEAYLFLNSRSGDITLKVDLNSFDSELDTIDYYLSTRNDQLIFTGHLEDNIFDFLNNQENSGKNYPMEGVLTLNNINNNIDAQYNVLKINNERDDLLRNVRVSLFGNFKSNSFKLRSVFPLLTGDITFQVNEAVVNVTE
jgi:hypothetical protein